MSDAPPGGGPGATVVATSRQHASSVPQDDPAKQPPADPAKVEPQQQPDPPAAQPAPAPDPQQLNLAADPKPAPAPEPKEVGDYGDHGLNVSVDYFVNTLGLDVNGKELTEAAAGNFAFLEAKIEALGDKAKGAGPIVALAKDSLERVRAAEKSKQEAAVKTVYEAVGGEENWKAVQTYARANLKPEELTEASGALSQGGFVAAAVAQALYARAQQGATVQGRPVVVASGPAAPAPGGGSRIETPEQYREEYRKLQKEHGLRVPKDKLDALAARVTYNRK